MAKREKKHSRVMFIITLDFPLGTDATGVVLSIVYSA